MAVLLTAPLTAAAYETDQFTNRLEPLEDATAMLDQRVNQTLYDLVVSWKGPRDEPSPSR